MPPQLKVIILIYLVAVNLIGFGLMSEDKKRAVRHKWRIKEKTLFLTAIIGGSAGVLLGMVLLRHKTRHNSFKLGIPLIIIVQIIAAALLLNLVQ
jgi:uncharacterized membrane protein YsdA (DUF1294 family)